MLAHSGGCSLKQQDRCVLHCLKHFGLQRTDADWQGHTCCQNCHCPKSRCAAAVHLGILLVRVGVKVVDAMRAAEGDFRRFLVVVIVEVVQLQPVVQIDLLDYHRRCCQIQ